MTTRGRSRRLTLALATLGVLVALATAGCSSASDGGATGSDDEAGTDGSSSPATEDTATPAPTPEPGDLQYVALGDSYAAAPGVPTSDMADGCFRSDHNYAHQVAASDDTIFLTDVTCSGATSDDVIADQVPALSAETDLVTVGIGGNDFGLFTRVLGGCLALASNDATGAPCTETATEELTEVAPQVQQNIGRVLDAIVAAAPQARVVVVGYPSLLPTSGSCPELVPLAEGDYPLVAGINQRLSDALEAEAAARDLDFVDVFGASAGHDVCSDDPWVNGQNVAADGTIPFHPFAEEQSAVAGMITALL